MGQECWHERRVQWLQAVLKTTSAFEPLEKCVNSVVLLNSSHLGKSSTDLLDGRRQLSEAEEIPRGRCNEVYILYLLNRRKNFDLRDTES